MIDTLIAFVFGAIVGTGLIIILIGLVIALEDDEWN